MTDFRGEDDEPPFDDVTVRMTMPVSRRTVRRGLLRQEALDRDPGR
jgi:hypothetical protein